MSLDNQVNFWPASRFLHISPKDSSKEIYFTSDEGEAELSLIDAQAM